MIGGSDARDHPGPDPSYGRVTEPERYVVLHGAARALLNELESEYVVTREAGGAVLDPALARGNSSDLIRLTPASEDSAPLAVAFTDFPGLYVRFGAWHLEAFPRCGCDHCDERPADLVEHLERRVRHLVHGQFSEEISGWFGRVLSYRFPGSSGWTRLEPGEELRSHRRQGHDWKAWPLR